jgi:long-chain fatty acid transport protein
VATGLLAVPHPVTAGPFDIYGIGSRSISLGGAATAAADDYTALFYNPANLVLRKRIHLGAELLTAVPFLDIAPTRGDSQPEPIEADGSTGIGLGVLFPLGGKLDYRFAFGLMIYLPTDQLLHVDALDPLIPRWYLWESLADKLQILAGVGAEVTPWLRLGVSIQSLASIKGGARIGIDPINEVFTERTISAELINTIAPIAGLNLGPINGLSFGFSWRSELKLDFGLPILLDFGDALDAGITAEGQSLFTPHTFSFGLAWAIPRTDWLVAADLRYALWSHVPDPAFFLAVDIGGELVEALGAEEVIDLLPGPSGLPDFVDTLSFHLGAEFWASELVVGRLGYQFRPTPIPEQVGLTNYVDNDAHTLSAGLGVTFPDPLNLDENPVTIELSGAYSILADRVTQKQTELDPVGDYLHGGEVLTISVSLRHDFTP